MSSSKYALAERERRFLVSELPRHEPSATRLITDLYLAGTRIRLRLSTGVVDGQPETLRKLTQKLPAPNGVVGHCGTITTMYLDEAEYAALSGLSGHWLSKQRFSSAPMGVDVFDGPLMGLIIAEAEFHDDEAMTAFAPPLWCGLEVTDHPILTGASLARMAAMPHSEAAAALAAVLSSISAYGVYGSATVAALAVGSSDLVD